MGARKINDQWYVDFRFNRERYRKRSPENSRAGASAYEALQRQKLARGEPLIEKKVKNDVSTFEAFAARWYETYVIVNNKPSEQRGKRLILSTHLKPYFGKMKLDEISTLKIGEYKAQKVKSGISPKTINNHLTVLRKCLCDAQEWIGLGSLPKFQLMNVPPQAFDFLSIEESQRLLAVIDDSFWHSMVLTALHTGMRHGELMGLRWQDVDFDQRIIMVNQAIVRKEVVSPKSNKQRHLPMSRDVWRELKARREKSGLVFSRIGGSRSMDKESPRLALLRFTQKVGMRKIGWHVLRHTFASQLVVSGVPLKAVQELLGHSDITTTMRYAHLAKSALRDAIDVLQGAYTNKSGNFGQQLGNDSESVISPYANRVFTDSLFPFHTNEKQHP